MKWANYAWGIFLFLIAGGVGWFLAVLATAFVVGKLFLDGHLTADEAHGLRPVTGAVPVLVGLALAWFTVGRKRWRQFRGEAREARHGLPKQASESPIAARLEAAEDGAIRHNRESAHKHARKHE